MADVDCAGDAGLILQQKRMSTLLKYKSKRSPAQNAVLALVFTVLAFFSFGIIPTQWFASTYAYDPNLGDALVYVGDVAIYAPPNWVLWGWRLVDVPTLKANVHTMLMMGVGSCFLSLLFGIFVAYRLGRYTPGMEGLHGTAHWADKADVDMTGFIASRGRKSVGVVVGSIMLDSKGKVIHPHHKKFAQRYRVKYKRGKGFMASLLFYLSLRKEPERDDAGRPKFEVEPSVVKKIELLRDGANTHLFAFCPTRSGKGVGMVLPTLLTWPDSVMVNDPKGEAFALTGGFRAAAGQEVIKFEPACINGTGARWNPLDEIRIYTPYDVQDAQMIMSMACDPKGEGLEDYFDKAGYEFLMGLALHVRYAEKNGSLEGVALFLGDPNWDSDKQMYEHMKNAVHDPEGKMGWKDSLGKPTRTHPIIANTAQTMLNKEDKDRSGVLSTAKSLLSLYLDPIVARNTCTSDFLVRDLMTGEKPVSLYYVVGPADMERMVPLTRLFYALFIRRNAAEMEFGGGRSVKSYSFPLLMIIDEATSLRKLPILQEALGYVAGYGIRMFMLVQDITQVEELYGDKQSFDSGAETRIVYAPNKIETAEKLARMTGKTTITEEKASSSKDLIGIKGGSVSLSVDKVARDLMTADEFMVLSDYDVVIFVKGKPPIYGRKAFYYENPTLLARAKIPPPARSAVLRKAAVVEDVVEVAAAPVKVEETVADKWAASRAALREQIGAAVAPVTSSSAVSVSQALNDGERRVAEVDPALVGRQRSRYADKVKAMSEDERRQVEMLVANVALQDKVIRLSAF